MTGADIAEVLHIPCHEGYRRGNLEAPLMEAVSPDVLVDIDCTELAEASDLVRACCPHPMCGSDEHGRAGHPQLQGTRRVIREG